MNVTMYMYLNNIIRDFYMIQLLDVDKSVWGCCKEGLMTFCISKYLTEYEHNKEETKR